MAFDLRNLLSYQSTSETQVNYSNGTEAIDSAEAAKILQAIRSLMPGQTIQGELIQKEGNSIQLLLNQGAVLNTNLEQDLMLNLGQKLTFEVKGNQNGQLTLRPLFENVAHDENAVKALEAAGIRVTEKTLFLVDELMKEGLPVNKEFLTNLNREMNQYREASIRDLIMLHKLEIPVTKESVEQMRLYQNQNQWMIENVSDLSNKLTELLEQLYSENESGAKQIFNELFGVLTEGDNHIENPVLLQEELDVVSHAQDADKSEMINQKMIEQNTEQELEPLKDKSTGKAIDTTFDFKQMTAKEILEQLKIETKSHTKGPIHQQIESILKEAMLMKPQDMKSDGYIKKYYEKILKLTGEMEELTKNINKQESGFAKEITQMKNNIDFMNQINECYHYIQLPLKMNDSHANGELLIYKRKKGSVNQDGKLTALLHLSMKTLGNMDIYLSLQNEKLSTKFCLEKEEMLDFIEAHIEELNARLNHKGYQTTTEVSLMDKNKENGIASLVHNGAGTQILSHQAFDARA